MLSVFHNKNLQTRDRGVFLLLLQKPTMGGKYFFIKLLLIMLNFLSNTVFLREFLIEWLCVLGRAHGYPPRYNFLTNCQKMTYIYMSMGCSIIFHCLPICLGDGISAK